MFFYNYKIIIKNNYKIIKMNMVNYNDMIKRNYWTYPDMCMPKNECLFIFINVMYIFNERISQHFMKICLCSLG